MHETATPGQLKSVRSRRCIHLKIHLAFNETPLWLDRKALPHLRLRLYGELKEPFSSCASLQGRNSNHYHERDIFKMFLDKDKDLQNIFDLKMKVRQFITYKLANQNH